MDSEAKLECFQVWIQTGGFAHTKGRDLKDSSTKDRATQSLMKVKMEKTGSLESSERWTERSCRIHGDFELLKKPSEYEQIGDFIGEQDEGDEKWEEKEDDIC